jgi:hypothetical protein
MMDRSHTAAKLLTKPSAVANAANFQYGRSSRHA